MTAGFRQLLNRHAMLAFERQLALMELLGPDHAWTLDLREGTAAFGRGRTYPLQLLGSRSAETNTWRWAWAPGAPVPARLLTAAKAVKAVGRKRLVPELIEQDLPLDALELDGHTLALVATALAQLPAYYRFPYEGGALFAALDAPDVVLGPPDPARLVRVVREVLSRMEVDDRTAFDTYLQARGARFFGDRSRVEARLPDGRAVVAEYDPEGRITGLGVRGAGAQPSENTR
jgi:hypothetical protein